MSVNSSGSSLHPLIYRCMDSSIAVDLSSIISSIRVMVLLPLCVLVLCLGLQRWRRPSQSRSHGDIFTLHLVYLELIAVVGFFVLLCGLYMAKPRVTEVGVSLTNQIFPAQMSFHFLTCLERYLAVVHPVTYRRMKQSAGVRIRNASVACVWLLCGSWTGISVLLSHTVPVVPLMLLLVLSLVIMSFCSLRVLRVLMRPRPGDVRAANRSKRRTIATVVAILLVQWLWFIALLVTMALDMSGKLGYEGGCVALVCGMGFTMPSSLVLPLLFLHRAGKRLCCVCSDGE
ncbi:hypothetical protein JOB18_033555 [Solea senegalensis]|uniref:G-protein coupled receptors family 1 profile domain-containing protein n=1 Tax=Solea senegalensis TaxID=28829 RepID=A0AAV6QX45_SOLSE|nr:hypothetical protein JOB18_033555 [Solea senegalensis]